jgi:hypothetical protein
MPDEADLLAWVEGEPLPRDRELAVARALEADKRLARRLAAMKSDRSALCSMPEVACPPGLLRAVEAQLQPVLERQMLLGLRDGEAIQDHLPVSIVQPVKKSIVAAFLRDRVGRRLAMAAGLLLVVGGVSIWATMSFSQWTTPKPVLGSANEPKKDDGTRLASNSEKAAAKAPGNPGPSKVTAQADKDAAGAPRPGALSETPAPTAVAKQDSPSPDLPGDEPEVTIAAAPAEHDDAAAVSVQTSPDIDTERAIELALEGRLVIRLRAADPTIATQPSRIADRIRRADSSMWRLGGEPPAEVLARLSPPPAPDPEPARSESRPMVLSAREGLASDLAPGFDGPPRPPEWLPPAKTVYMIETRLDDLALDSLLSAVQGTYGDAIFEEASEPLPEDAMTPLNPAAVIWWPQPASGWVKWANVPLVIDTAR